MNSELTDRDLLKIGDFPELINISTEEKGLYGEITKLGNEFILFEMAKEKRDEDAAQRHIKEFENQLQKIKYYLKI